MRIPSNLECIVGLKPLSMQRQERTFANTAEVLRTLEAVSVAVSQNEPVLLVGETGTGKSTLVQQIASQVIHSDL